MAMIKGIIVTLYEKIENGADEFGRTIYNEVPVEVENVLVAPVTSDDVLDTTNLTGKKAVYHLAIPKGDTHDWRDKKVRFFGKVFKVFGEPIVGMEEMIPLEWNKKVTVELYE